MDPIPITGFPNIKYKYINEYKIYINKQQQNS